MLPRPNLPSRPGWARQVRSRSARRHGGRVYEQPGPTRAQLGACCGGQPHTPVSFQFVFGKVHFTGDHLAVLVVTPVVLGALAVLVWRRQPEEPELPLEVAEQPL